MGDMKDQRTNMSDKEIRWDQDIHWVKNKIKRARCNLEKHRKVTRTTDHKAAGWVMNSEDFYYYHGPLIETGFVISDLKEVTTQSITFANQSKNKQKIKNKN